MKLKFILQRYSFSSWGCRLINSHKEKKPASWLLMGGSNCRITFRFHYVEAQWGEAGHALCLHRVWMVLIRLEISLQCSSKACLRERVVGRAEQAMMHVPGSLQGKSYLQRSSGSWSSSQAFLQHHWEWWPQADRVPGCMAQDGGPGSDWAGRVNPFMGLKSRTDFH